MTYIEHGNSKDPFGSTFATRHDLERRRRDDAECGPRSPFARTTREGEARGGDGESGELPRGGRGDRERSRGGGCDARDGTHREQRTASDRCGARFGTWRPSESRMGEAYRERDELADWGRDHVGDDAEQRQRR